MNGDSTFLWPPGVEIAGTVVGPYCSGVTPPSEPVRAIDRSAGVWLTGPGHSGRIDRDDDHDDDDRRDRPKGPSRSAAPPACWASSSSAPSIRRPWAISA